MMTFHTDSWQPAREGMTAKAAESSAKSQGSSDQSTSDAFLRLSSLKASTASDPLGSWSSARWEGERPFATV